MRIRSRSTPQDRRRLLRRTGTAVCPRVHRDARYRSRLTRRVPPPVVRREILPVGRAVGSRPRSTTAVAAMFHSRESPRPHSGRESLRLRSARRRRRRDRRLSSPGSALRSAPPYSPATWRPAGEVRHRPCFEGPSRQRHRTDTARQRPPDRTDATAGQSRGTEDLGVPRVDRRIGRSLRPDDEVWRGSRHGCGRRRHQSQDRFYVFAPNGVRRQTAPDDRD